MDISHCQAPLYTYIYIIEINHLEANRNRIVQHIQIVVVSFFFELSTFYPVFHIHGDGII